MAFPARRGLFVAAEVVMTGDARVSNAAMFTMVKEHGSRRVLQIDAICFYSAIISQTANDGSDYCDKRYDR
jgi:hypothetical protein